MKVEADTRMSRASSEPPAAAYEPPRLVVLGSVHALTQLQDKKYGDSDGFTFMGTPIANVS
jgi:hypothetical protein